MLPTRATHVAIRPDPKGRHPCGPHSRSFSVLALRPCWWAVRARATAASRSTPAPAAAEPTPGPGRRQRPTLWPHTPVRGSGVLHRNFQWRPELPLIFPLHSPPHTTPLASSGNRENQPQCASFVHSLWFPLWRSAPHGSPAATAVAAAAIPAAARVIRALVQWPPPVARAAVAPASREASSRRTRSGPTQLDLDTTELEHPFGRLSEWVFFCVRGSG